MDAKLLLDEKLSPRVALALQGDGIDAVHIRDRRGLGLSDRAVLDRAFQEDRILVTIQATSAVNGHAQTRSRSDEGRISAWNTASLIWTTG